MEQLKVKTNDAGTGVYEARSTLSVVYKREARKRAVTVVKKNHHSVNRMFQQTHAEASIE